MKTRAQLLAAIRQFEATFTADLGEHRPGQLAGQAHAFFDLLEEPGAHQLGTSTDSAEMSALLEPALGRLLGRPVSLGRYPVVRIPDAAMCHGTVMVPGQMVMFFWFERPAAGLCVVHPFTGGETHFIRLSKLPAA